MSTQDLSVIIGRSNLKKEQLWLAKSAIVSALKDLAPKTAASKKRRKNNNDDELDLIASRIIAKYNTVNEKYKGNGIEWEPWHCFVGTDIVYAVRPRQYFMAELTGGTVLQDRKLSLFAFRSAPKKVQDELRNKTKPESNALQNIDPDPDHMDRTQIVKVRTDMDGTMYNAFEDVCRIALAKKHAQNRQYDASSSSSTAQSVVSPIIATTTATATTIATKLSSTPASSSTFDDGAMYIRSRLEMMEVFGGEWHVVAAKANKGELSGARACSANIDADASSVTIVTGGGVRIFAFQHADNSPTGDGCCSMCIELMTTKSRTFSMLIMFALMFAYFLLGKIEALKCLEGISIDLICNEETLGWANTVETLRTGVLVSALGFFVVAAVLKTLKASKHRAQHRSLKKA